jgi:hypothetical protein
LRSGSILVFVDVDVGGVGLYEVMELIIVQFELGVEERFDNLP